MLQKYIKNEKLIKGQNYCKLMIVKYNLDIFQNIFVN